MIYKLATSMLMCSAASASFVGSAPMGAATGSRVLDDIQMSGVKRNANIGKLQAGYLFPEIGRRRNAFLEKNPDANIISLGIGDTTQPVPEHILAGLAKGVTNLGAKETYSGYGAEQGQGPLRAKIASALYDDKIAPEEVFVSDGSKCDIGRLQMMFGREVTSAVQVCCRHAAGRAHSGRPSSVRGGCRSCGSRRTPPVAPPPPRSARPQEPIVDAHHHHHSHP